MRTTIRLSLLTAFALFVCRSAGAGLLDSPAPSFNGTAGEVVYRFGPAHYEPGQVDTVVKCTNQADKPAPIDLQIYDDQDTLAGEATAPNVGPNTSVAFVTSSNAGVPDAVVVPGLAPIDHGKARISSTTAQLSCTALHRVIAGDGTAKELPVELLKKVARQ